MNPFQSLINDCLIGTKHVENAALIVAKTGDITAVSSKFQIHSKEAQMLTDAFKHLDATRGQGVCFKERKFRCVRADRNSIYCKSIRFQEFDDVHKISVFVVVVLSRMGAPSDFLNMGGQGLILVKTALYVMVATYTESMYPSVCVEAVEKLAEYLREKGK